MTLLDQILHAQRSVGQRHESEGAQADDPARRIALVPFDEEDAPPKVECAAMDEQLAGVEEERLALQREPVSEPVGRWYERRDGRIDVRSIE